MNGFGHVFHVFSFPSAAFLMKHLLASLYVIRAAGHGAVQHRTVSCEREAAKHM